MTAFLCIPVAEGHALDFLRTILTPNQAGEFDADVLPLAQVSPFPQETQTPASSKDTQWSEALPRLWTYLRDDTKAIMVFIAERAGERVTIASLEDEFGGFRGPGRSCLSDQADDHGQPSSRYQVAVPGMEGRQHRSFQLHDGRRYREHRSRARGRVATATRFVVQRISRIVARRQRESAIRCATEPARRRLERQPHSIPGGRAPLDWSRGQIPALL